MAFTKDGKLILSAHPTLKELQPLFEQTILNQRTWRGYSRAMTQACIFFRPDRQPKDIFRKDTEEYLTWLALKGYSLYSQHWCKAACSSWFTWMQAYGIIENNPFAKIKKHKVYQYYNQRPL